MPKISPSTYIPGAWNPEELGGGTHVPLPLDGAVSDAVVEKVAIAIRARNLSRGEWADVSEQDKNVWRTDARIAIAALAAALGEEA